MWRRRAVLLVILIMEGLPLTFGDTIEVNSDITTNQIWTDENTYRITETIGVQALLVIEPGTVIKFAYDVSLIIDNGGVLISRGTPDNPIIYTYDSDPQNGAYCAIFIDETASASTKITYSYIEYAYIGIWIMNNRLDSPIENNYLYNNSSGILEYGVEHTDIYNNLIIASSYGIEINMESYEGQASADSHILIQNNTCDRQDVGIAVFGVDNEADAGEAELINNIVSGSSQYGLVLANGWMYFTVSNTGYYDNDLNKNWEFEEYNPVYEATLPYVEGTGTLPVCYLRPDCAFVNASDEYVEQTRLIGKTTDINSFPDSNLADLGFHYPNWNFSNAGSSTLYSDFDGNWRVDFIDLSEFAGYWLYDYNDNQRCESWDLNDTGQIDFNDLYEFAEGWLTEYDFVDFAAFANYWRRQVDYRFEDRRFDLVADNIVDFKDFSKFAEQWRETTEEGTNPPIEVAVYGDPNNLFGNVDIGINGRSDNTTEGFICIDGELKGWTRYSDDIELNSESSSIDTMAFGNGSHEIKVVTIDVNGLITVSQALPVDINNDLYYVSKANDFNEGEDYHLYAMSSSPNEFRVKFVGWDDSTAWTSSASTGGLNITVPSGVLTGAFYDVIIEMETGSPPSFQPIAQNTIKAIPKTPSNYKVAIFLPNGRFRGTGLPTAECRPNAVAALVSWCEIRHIKYVILYRGACTWPKFYEIMSLPSLSYVYLVGHGGRDVPRFKNDPDPVHRLYFYVSGPKGPNDIEPVFSYKGGLPAGWDTNPRGHSMEELGLGSSTKIRCAYLTVCYQGESTEMARRWIMYDPIPLNQLFCGFSTCVEGYNPDWMDFDCDFWASWGSGQVMASDVINDLFDDHPIIWFLFNPWGWTQMYMTASGN